MASTDQEGIALSDSEIAERLEGSHRESKSVRIALAALIAVEVVLGLLWYFLVYRPNRYPSTLAAGDTRTALAILGMFTVIIGVQFLLEVERLAERLRLARLQAGSNLTGGRRVWCHVVGYLAVIQAVSAVVVLLVFVGRPSWSWSYLAELLVVVVGAVAAVVVAALPRRRLT